MQEDLRKRLRKRVFLGGGEDPKDFVAFYPGDNLSDDYFSKGKTLNPEPFWLTAFDEIESKRENPNVGSHEDAGIDKFLKEAFEAINVKEEEYAEFKDRFLRQISDNYGRFKLSDDYRHIVDGFIDFAVKVPEMALLPSSFWILLDRGGDISNVAPWHQPDLKDKAAGFCNMNAYIIAVAVGCSELSMERIANHEIVHAYDWLKKKISLGLSDKDMKLDHGKLSQWLDLVEKIKTAADNGYAFFPRKKIDKVKMGRWMKVAQKAFRPEFIKERIAESYNPYQALLLDMVERIDDGFSLSSPLYDLARAEYKKGNKWLIKSEHLAYFAEMVRTYSAPEEWLDPNAPILKLAEILAPKLTKFYREVYLEKNLAPDMEAYRKERQEKHPVTHLQKAMVARGNNELWR